MSELLAVLSNPKRRKRKARRGRRRNPIGMHRDSRGRYVPMGGRARRRASTMKSVHRSSGARVSRAAWRRSGYRRNPRPGVLAGFGRGRVFVQNVGQDLVAAVAGAAGGVALDFLMRPLPLAVKAGPLNHLVRGAASIGLGLVAHVARVPIAAELAKGAMTITLYNAARQYVLLPRGLGELSDEDLTQISDCAMDAGVGEVISLPSAAAGDYSPMGEWLHGVESGELYDEMS